MKEEFDMQEVVAVAWGTMKARRMGAKKAAEAVAKSFKMTDEEQLTLEQCLVELLLGISAVVGPALPFQNHSPSDYLALYKEAVLAGDGTVNVCGHECSARAVESSVGQFISYSMR